MHREDQHIENFVYKLKDFVPSTETQKLDPLIIRHWVKEDPYQNLFQLLNEFEAQCLITVVYTFQ